MKSGIKVLIIIGVLFSLVIGCGADDIKHRKSEDWDVALQRSTGFFSITYIGNASQLRDLEYEITGTNIQLSGSALQTQKTPFHFSGTVTDSYKTKDPIIFKVHWNDKSETFTLE